MIATHPWSIKPLLTRGGWGGEVQIEKIIVQGVLFCFIVEQVLTQQFIHRDGLDEFFYVHDALEDVDKDKIFGHGTLSWIMSTRVKVVITKV